MTTAKAIVLALVTDGITLATTFGIQVAQAKETAILAFVGTVTTAAAALYTWHESHKIAAKSAIATSTSTEAPAAAKQITGG